LADGPDNFLRPAQAPLWGHTGRFMTTLPLLLHRPYIMSYWSVYQLERLYLMLDYQSNPLIQPGSLIQFLPTPGQELPVRNCFNGGSKIEFKGARNHAKSPRCLY